MKKWLGIGIVGLALIAGIVPLFTDCLSQGRALTTTTGMTVPMKCHWTAIAEIGAAIPLGIIGLSNILSKRKESLININLLGMVLGALVVAFPMGLIGVCANPSMTCNMVMKPTLVATGTLALIACLAIFVTALRMPSEIAPRIQHAGSAA